MKLSELIAAAGGEAEGEAEITGLSYDNRKVRPGDLFFCVPGHTSDGHDFAPAAVEAGAAALVVERPLGLGRPEAIVDDARAAMAPVAARFYGNPTEKLLIAGVTGTNGKTTTAFLIRAILEAAGMKCGLLGTVQQVVGGAEEEVERTTPEAIELQATFARMVQAGDEACSMEVSSHALALHRSDGILFDARVFTNLTQDHLDFHADMEDYFAAKRRLFVAAGGERIVNVDNPYGRRLAEEFDTVTYSAAGVEEADYRAEAVTYDTANASFRCVTPAGEFEVRTPLPGHFNVSNALGAIAAANALGVEPADAVGGLRDAGRVPGRFEPIEEGQPFTVLVDYAHTPDSLDNVLRAARRLTEAKVITVFGCGGDRDREKRPLMGKAGAELSDVAIITSDNPRSEEPAAIIDEILAGIADADGRVEVEPDRRAAIGQALAQAAAGDVVLIAGKGHEQGQEFEGGRKVPFDDREVAREELRRLASPA